MVSDGNIARKEAATCMSLAAKSTGDEQRAVLRELARTWVTLANQMDRLQAINATRKIGVISPAKRKSEKISHIE